MVTRLAAAHGRTRRQIEAESQRLLQRAWLVGDEDAFIEQAITIEDAALAATVGEVDAYLTTFLLAAGTSTSPVGLDADSYRRPVDPETLWGRPHKQMRMRLADGASFPEASRFGSHMASSLLATDLQFAARGAATSRLAGESTINGYRRITTGSNPCGLCVAASDQLYHVEQLMPIHDNCGCAMAPVSTTQRTGLSEGEYERVLEQTGGDTSPEALSRVKLDPSPGDPVPFRVVEHGELGPYLFDANHAAPLLDAAA